MSLRHLLTALAALTLTTASVQAQTTAQNGGRLRAFMAQKQATAAEAALPAGVQRIADVPYGSDPRQRMDVYVPTGLAASAVRAPVIFMVHGGGWRHGDKAMGRVVPCGVIVTAMPRRVHASTSTKSSPTPWRASSTRRSTPSRLASVTGAE